VKGFCTNRDNNSAGLCCYPLNTARWRLDRERGG
jgi:hypothetical protein